MCSDRDAGEASACSRHLELKLEMWITMHEDLRSSPRRNVTFDGLVKGLASHMT